jgi:hypothetical protein
MCQAARSTDGVTQKNVSLFREPDAVTPPVRFDEREQEAEPSQTGLRRRSESPANSHREAKVTAPVLDSTSNPQSQGKMSDIAILRQLK